MYAFLAILLSATYIVCISYLLAFRIGYSQRYPKSSKKASFANEPEVSVIVPIYNEDTGMIKGTLDTLLGQERVRINLIAVIKDARPGQIRMIESYRKRLNKVKVIIQEGKPSHNEAFLIGLRHVKTKYTCILCSDAKIKKNRLSMLLAGLENEKKDAACGLLYPEIKDTIAGRFTAIAKIFRQDLTLKGRAALGLGCFIPGAFAVYRTKFLKAELRDLMKNNFVMHDLGLTMRLSARTKDKLYFMPEVVGTELEKSTFSGWMLQHMRWFMGTLGLASSEMDVLLNAKGKIRAGTFGLIVIWNVLPFAMFAGMLLSVASAFWSVQFIAFYLATYVTLTLILLSLSDARAYGWDCCALYWLISSSVQSLGVIASVYGFAFAKYRENRLYALFKR